jgi:hypothetical protein
MWNFGSPVEAKSLLADPGPFRVDEEDPLKRRKDPRVGVADTSDSERLCNWWRLHRDELPQMVEAARDYPAIPASEVVAWFYTYLEIGLLLSAFRIGSSVFCSALLTAFVYVAYIT